MKNKRIFLSSLFRYLVFFEYYLMSFIGIYYLLDMVFYATYARKFKDVNESLEDMPSNLKECKIKVEFTSTYFWLENKNGTLKVFNYYIYLLSHILFQLTFLLFLLLYLSYNVENANSISERFSIYFSRPLDQTFPTKARCDFSSCTSGRSVRVEQLNCQVQINVHLQFIIPCLIGTTFCTCMYGLLYILFFQVMLYNGKCQNDRHCQDCNVHIHHCSQKFKLLQYIKYPIFQTRKIEQAMRLLNTHDIICLIIISREIKQFDFCAFFENYLNKKETGASSISSLIPDTSNL